MSHFGNDKHQQNRFRLSWKTFAIDNSLKIGDACVLELEESSDEKFRFRAQILRGDLPSKFQNDSEDGETADNPIYIG